MVSFLLDWAVRAGFLAAAAGLVVAIIRMRDVRARLALWSALLFGSLALPALRPLMPPLLPATNAAPLSVNAPVALHHAITPLRVRTAMTTMKIAPARRGYLPEIAVAEIPLAEIALGLWAAGALLLLARLATGLILARRVIRAAVPIDDRIRPMRGLRVFESARVNVPLTAGVLRPVILLPEDWREWESERLRAVLAHERSHVERRDALVRVAAQLQRAVLWFSPVAWWLDGHLADLAECASDDAALAETVDRSAYAAIVLDFFRAGKKRLAIEGLAMAQGGSAERRIDRILAGGPLCAHLRRGTLVAVLALTGGSVALVAALQSAPAAPTPPSPAAAAAPRIAPVPPMPEAPPAPKPAPEPAAAPEIAPAPEAAAEPEGTGDSWVIFHGESTTMGGDIDPREAQGIHDRANHDLIWARRGGKAWVIDDAGLLRRATELFAPVDDLAKKEEALNKEQEAINHAQEDQWKAMEKMHGSMPLLEDDLKKLEEQSRIKEPTAEQLSQLEAKLAEMQARLAEAQETMVGRQQSEIDRQMGELDRRQDEIGRVQDAFGKEQERAAGEAERMLERLLDEAIRNGMARPSGVR